MYYKFTAEFERVRISNNRLAFKKVTGKNRPHKQPLCVILARIAARIASRGLFLQTP